MIQHFKLIFVLLLVVFSSLALPAHAERILLFAPHPDDEVISLGGWLADCIASGAQVWAVLVTDGEAFPKAVRANRLARGPILRSPDFLRLGKLRREEARRSLSILGILPERRFFLGYPCNTLWQIFRSIHSQEPLRSRATQQRFGLAEWGMRKREAHPFSRDSWAANVDSILKLVKPDLLVIPIPLDTNSDHRAVAMMADERWRMDGQTGKIMGYLVHHGSRFQYPKPFGYHPEASLYKPTGFSTPTVLHPSEAGRRLKEKAIRAHLTQINLKDGFLLSFIRKVEIFWPLKPWDSARYPALTLGSEDKALKIRALLPRREKWDWYHTDGPVPSISLKKALATK